MFINNINKNISPNFQAKLSLKELNKVYSKPSFKIEKTCIDTMFNENYLVKKLDNYSIFMKNNVLCKYFSKPKTKVEKILALIQYKSILYARKLADRIFLLQNLVNLYITKFKSAVCICFECYFSIHQAISCVVEIIMLSVDIVNTRSIPFVFII